MNKIENGFKIKTNTLIIGDVTLQFEYPIQKVLELSGMLIILLEKPFKTIYNENVFGFSIEEGKIKWQIPKINYSTGLDCPFIDILFFESKLRLNNWCDIHLIVNPLTGEILERSKPLKY